MEFGELSKREALLYVTGCADGMESFREAIDILEKRFGDFIPYKDLRELNQRLIKTHRKITLRQVEALYDTPSKNMAQTGSEVEGNGNCLRLFG